MVKCLNNVSCYQDGDPCRVGIAMTDMSTGLYATTAILASLMYRHQSGRGQYIDCNLLNTQVHYTPSCIDTSQTGGSTLHSIMYRHQSDRGQYTPSCIDTSQTGGSTPHSIMYRHQSDRGQYTTLHHV